MANLEGENGAGKKCAERAYYRDIRRAYYLVLGLLFSEMESQLVFLAVLGAIAVLPLFCMAERR